MRMQWLLWPALVVVLGRALVPIQAEASRWGSAYGDPPSFCPAQSLLPASYTSLVTNDPSVAANPERDTFWGIHPNPGYDDWYGYWYGDFEGRPGDASGWRFITRAYLGQVGHWDFADWGWRVHGHAKQYIGYFNWTFAGQCGLRSPYMADVFGNPVVDIYVDSVPPNPPAPRVLALTTDSVIFGWDPVTDRGDGAGADYYEAGMDHYRSWLTVGGGPPVQIADTVGPRRLTATGLGKAQDACLHVIAYDRLQNATPEQQACARVLTPPPAPAPPPPPTIGVSPAPFGLVGLETWYWLNPAPATTTTDLNLSGYRYRVTQAPTGVDWAFGDGSTQALAAPEGLGLAYPAQSPITHVYQRHSAAGYPVSATVRWSLSWSVLAAGKWYGPYALGTQNSAPALLNYPVRQAQTELLAT
jgi:hypothetical protein